MVEKVNTAPLEGRLSNDPLKSADEMLELNFIRHKLESFQTTIVKDVKKSMAVMMDEIMQELQQQELQTQEFKNFANVNNNNKSRRNHNSEGATWSNRILKEKTTAKTDETATNTDSGDGDRESTTHKTQKRHHKSHSSSGGLRKLPDKIFIARESYLTALLKVDHMSSIYHIFQIIFLTLCLNTIMHDYFVEGEMNFGLKTFKDGFRGMRYVLGIWLLEHVFVFLLYYAFCLWSYVRERLQKQASLQSFWSHSCLILYIASQLVFGYVGTIMCVKLNLPYVTSCVLLLESIRLMMKMHSFIRTNAERVVTGKLKCDADLDTSTQTPTTKTLAPFSWYLYFLFAPTLLYRDSYPRTSSIRWKFAICRFAEGLAVAFLLAYLHERHSFVHFGNYGLEPMTASDLIMKFFGMAMPSTIIFLGGFYLLLHAWLNFTSELLRFGDRMFYQDWWTANNYDAYYRKWNVVVHDWLYEYIYKECYYHLFRGSKTAASLMVFYVSAVVHEHVIGFGLKFFLPVLFVFFGGVGMVCLFIIRRAPRGIGNTFIWFSLIYGNGLMVSLYYMEYFARKNCNLDVSHNESWSDVFIPVFWKCRYNENV